MENSQFRSPSPFPTRSTGCSIFLAGDTILVSSKGLAEAIAPDGDIIGYDRVATELLQLSGMQAQGVVDGMLDAVTTFLKGHPPSNDMTLVTMVFRRGMNWPHNEKPRKISAVLSESGRIARLGGSEVGKNEQEGSMSKKISTLFLCLFCLVLSAGAETLDEVLAKNYEARGGLEKLKSVNSVKVSGTMDMGGGMEAPFTYYWQRPNKMRNEFTIQGKTGIQAYDGQSGWMLMPFMGKTEPEKIPDELAKNMDDEADFEGSLVGWQEKGHQVELIGKESIEGTEAYKIKVVRKSGNESTIYLDAEYYLEIKEETSREINGQTIEVESSTGDYKEVDGLMLSHSMTTQAKGAPNGQAITFETIELNIELDPSIFVMPEAEAKAEGDEETK